MKNYLESPVIQIDSLKTKFDTVVVSNSLIALLDHNYNEARFLQQLHYWCFSKYGVVIDGIRWIYKSGREFITEALVGLTEWKLRMTVASLLEKNLIRREKLYVKHHEQEYKAPWWNPKNQTYYYSVNYEELQKLIEKAESTGNVRFAESTKLSVEDSAETKVCGLSQNRSKNTNKRKPTTKQEKNNRFTNESDLVAAVTSNEALEGEKTQTEEYPLSAELNASPSQIKQELEQGQSNIGGETKVAKVDHIVNKDWKSLIPLLDSAGVAINRTIKDLLKLYPSEKVESAITILKERRRDKYIPNLSGYFVAALQGDWSSQSSVAEESGDNAADKDAVFRYWYDLAKSLGYCSGQEVREGEQWVNLSGSWEKWESAIERGYSLEYLRKILKRNKN